MSLQVAAGVLVGSFLSVSDEGSGMANRPEPVRVEPRGANSILTLTSRDIFDEARQRLARKHYHWE